jgi:hypothetical protein
MTRIFSTGFETGESSEFEGDASIGTADSRSGLYRIALGSPVIARFVISAEPEIYVGFGIYITGTSTTSRNMFTISGSSGEIFSMRNSSTSTVYSIYIQGNLLHSFDRPVLNEWHYVQIHAKVDSVSGEFTLKINGEEIYSFTGDTGSANMTALTFGSTSTLAPTFLIDDFIINNVQGLYNNSWTGQPKLIPAVIDGDGSVTVLSRGGVDSGANWSQVSPIPASDTGYVYTGNSDEYDLYTVAETLPSALPEGAIIINLIVVTRGRVDGGAGSGCGVLKSGDTLFEGDPKVFSGTFSTRNDAFPTDEGGITWTLERANAVEIGPMAKDLE